jgi:hypothetical protein
MSTNATSEIATPELSRCEHLRDAFGLLSPRPIYLP